MNLPLPRTGKLKGAAGEEVTRPTPKKTVPRKESRRDPNEPIINAINALGARMEAAAPPSPPPPAVVPHTPSVPPISNAPEPIDYSEALDRLTSAVEKLADKKPVRAWEFTIKRDHRGNIDTVSAQGK